MFALLKAELASQNDAGNYGGAFYPTQLARQQGFDQVLWQIRQRTQIH